MAAIADASPSPLELVFGVGAARRRRLRWNWCSASGRRTGVGDFLESVTSEVVVQCWLTGPGLCYIERTS